MAVLRAMRQAAAHDAVEGVRLVSCDETVTVVELTMLTELPASWRAAGESPSGVRAREPVTVRFPSRFPLAGPLIELRDDFNRSHPHINPSPVDQPVRPCLVAGSVRELVQARGFFGLMEQIASWLEKASNLSLNDPDEDWEPVRRDAIDDIVAADAAALRWAATPAGGAEYRLVTYVISTGGYYRLVLSRTAIPLNRDAARMFKRDEQKNFSVGTGVAVIAWAGRKGGTLVLADRYMPETVATVGDLLDRAEAYGCGDALRAKLSWAATRIDAHPPAHPVPVVVLLLARRPRNVIGTGSPIEVCPYLVEARAGSDLTDPAKPVRIAALRDELSIPVLRRAAGMDPEMPRPTWTLVGCGSVGSKLALHLARAGMAPGVLVDQDWFEPHNYARHAGLPSWEHEALFFRPKVDEVARQLAALRQAPTATARADVIALASDPAQRERLVGEATRAIVDTTGSPVVREALSNMPKTEQCRGLEACLMGGGTVGYLSIEGPDGNPSASDLVVEAYRAIAAEDELARRVFGSEAQAVTIGQGCSAVTFAMPDGRLSALTASMATPIARWLGGDMPEGGELRLGRLGVDEASQDWSALPVAPWIIVERGAGEPVARLHPRVHAAIEADVAQWKGVETGGVLIGRYNEAGELFQIVDVLPAPEDSTRAPELFTLGTRGLKRAIRETVERSGGALQAVGTWHSHLAPSGPSLTDVASGAMLAMRQLAPLLMLICTPAGYTHLVAEATDAPPMEREAEMALSSLIKDLNLDRYDRNARLQPALLVLLPVILLIGTWYPPARTGSGWIASLLVACGATFLLAQATRRRGRALEQNWGDRIGSRHSARLLSFEDQTLSASHKERIADWVGRHGPGLPTQEEERLDARSAEDRRLAAVKWLLEATRADAAGSMLLAENVSYGFWRNMRGLRPIGITVALGVIVCDAFLLWRVGIANARFWPGAAVLAGGAVAAIAWAFLVSRRSVEDASLAFAERLFAQIDNPAVAQRLQLKPVQD